VICMTETERAALIARAKRAERVIAELMAGIEAMMPAPVDPVGAPTLADQVRVLLREAVLRADAEGV